MPVDLIRLRADCISQEKRSLKRLRVFRLESALVRLTYDKLNAEMKLRSSQADKFAV